MKFLVADDHAIIRKGLVLILKEEFPGSLVGEVVNGVAVLAELKNQNYDVLIMDISMPDKNGIETLKQIRSNGNAIPILMLSIHPEEQYAVRVLKGGASGFLNKNSATAELVGAVRKVLNGGRYVSPSLSEKLLGNLESGDQGVLIASLSDREVEVTQQIAKGKTVTEIASELSLSVNTISTYRTRILEKLDLKNTAELIRFALDNNMV
jgi:two-component system invasion response regulator UvrY